MNIRFIEEPERTYTALKHKTPIPKGVLALLGLGFAMLIGSIPITLLVYFGGLWLFPAFAQSIMTPTMLALLCSMTAGLFPWMFASFWLLKLLFQTFDLVMDGLGVSWLDQRIAWQDITAVLYDDAFVTISSREEVIRLDLSVYSREEVHRLGARVKQHFEQATKLVGRPSETLTPQEQKHRAAINQLAQASKAKA